LDAVHARGIVHRDVKPANIFITESGVAKLLDLGLATAVSGKLHSDADLPGADELADASVTSTGSAVGTAAFMAPEQARGEAVDARADLFSVGVTLYQITTGRLPFSGSVAMTLDGICHREPPEPRTLNPELPKALEKIILKALQKDPAARYASAVEMRAELQRLRQPLPHMRIAAAGLLLVCVALLFAITRPASREVRMVNLVPRQVTANPLEDRVFRAAISPGGDRLAYTDLAGIHLRRIDTGETLLIPPPEDFCFR
jgi:hypothetical protein